jgi:hypothetical protein
MKSEQQHAHDDRQTRLTAQSGRSTRPGAIRMIRLRERRRRGFRVFQIEVCDGDLEALIARGFLDRLERSDPTAIERAIGCLLERLT